MEAKYPSFKIVGSWIFVFATSEMSLTVSIYNIFVFLWVFSRIQLCYCSHILYSSTSVLSCYCLFILILVHNWRWRVESPSIQVLKFKNRNHCWCFSRSFPDLTIGKIYFFDPWLRSCLYEPHMKVGFACMGGLEAPRKLPFLFDAYGVFSS